MNDRYIIDGDDDHSDDDCIKKQQAYNHAHRQALYWLITPQLKWTHF